MKTPIKSWSEDDRPREKMVKYGTNALSNSELIAILLSSGNKNETAIDLARRMLSDCDEKLNAFAQHSTSSLQKYDGVGEAKAVTLLAAIELGRRIVSEAPEKKTIISSSKDAFNAIFRYLSNLKHEEFYVIFLNRSKKIISIKKINEGSTNSVSIDVKKILRLAIEETAAAMILCHNHPGGNFLPSDQDIQLTKSIKDSCEIIDIDLIDHIITAGNKYYSFSDSRQI